MTAVAIVDQELITKSSLLIQEEECHKEIKYQCKQCDF